MIICWLCLPGRFSINSKKLILYKVYLVDDKKETIVFSKEALMYSCIWIVRSLIVKVGLWVSCKQLAPIIQQPRYRRAC